MPNEAVRCPTCGDARCSEYSPNRFECESCGGKFRWISPVPGADAGTWAPDVASHSPQVPSYKATSTARNASSGSGVFAILGAIVGVIALVVVLVWVLCAGLWSAATYPLRSAIREAGLEKRHVEETEEWSMNAGALKAQFVEDPIANGWLPLPNRVMVKDYDLRHVPNGREGPIVYTGLNCALAEGGTVEGEVMPFSDSAGWGLEIGKGTEWTYLADAPRPIPIETGGGLYLKGSLKGFGARNPDQLLTAILTLREPEGARVRVATHRLAESDQMLAWGRLPDPKLYNWRLYVRYARPDGIGLDETLLALARGGIRLTDAAGQILHQEPIVVEETTRSQSIVEAASSLEIAAPRIDGGTWIEVILLITPKN